MSITDEQQKRDYAELADTLAAFIRTHPHLRNGDLIRDLLWFLLFFVGEAPVVKAGEISAQQALIESLEKLGPEYDKETASDRPN